MKKKSREQIIADMDAAEKFREELEEYLKEYEQHPLLIKLLV